MLFTISKMILVGYSQWVRPLDHFSLPYVPFFINLVKVAIRLISVVSEPSEVKNSGK